jgi:hypothetical protein
MSMSNPGHRKASTRSRTSVRILQIAILAGLVLVLIGVIGVGGYMVWRDSQVPVASDPGATATAACIEYAGSHPGTPCPPAGALAETATASDPGGTATAACVEYAGSHPGTPCPPAEVPAETATALCRQFITLHPGTPCP